LLLLWYDLVVLSLAVLSFFTFCPNFFLETACSNLILSTFVCACVCVCVCVCCCVVFALVFDADCAILRDPQDFFLFCLLGGGSGGVRLSVVFNVGGRYIDERGADMRIKKQHVEKVTGHKRKFQENPHGFPENG